MPNLPVYKFGEVVSQARVSDIDFERLAEFKWNLGSAGYAFRASGRRFSTVFMHREVLGLMAGDGVLADHINGDRLDNRRENLRACTPAENGQNTSKRPGTSSRYRGVTWHKRHGRWQAAATVQGKYHYLGLFDEEEEAGSVAAAFRAGHMPFSKEASL